MKNPIFKLAMLFCLVLLFMGCGNSSSSTLPENFPSTGTTPNQPQVQTQSAANLSETFGNLNAAFRSKHCGIWQFFKRKPHNEQERMITENSYLDLRNDYTYSSGGWIVEGNGRWMPVYNHSVNGEQLSYIVFTNLGNSRNECTTVRAELITENGTELLRISDLTVNSFDYYIRK